MRQGQSRRRLLHGAAASGTVLLAGGAMAQTPARPMADDRRRLYELLSGFQITQMLHVAAQLGIADLLNKGSKTVSELATLTKTHEDSLYRLLRTLAGHGIFFEEEGPRFRLTPMAEMLRSDVPGSFRVTAEAFGEHWMWRPWGHLMHSVKTGEVAFDELYGKHTWEWFAENPGPAELFNAFMDEITTAETRAVVSGYDFSQAKKVVDIGGGRGVLLTAVLGQNARVRGVLFDLPHVIESAKKELNPSVAGRIELAPGDFFKAVPGGGDLYLLKNIIHDWNDERSRAILGTCHRAMRGRGRLLLVEHIVCKPNQPCPSKSSDMTMMVRNGGRNRTEEEYRKLLAASGFSLGKVLQTADGPGLLEAEPRG